MDLAHLLRKFGLEVRYVTLTLGTNPGYAEEAFYGHMQEDSVRVEHLFQVCIGVNPYLPSPPCHPLAFNML